MLGAACVGRCFLEYAASLDRLLKKLTPSGLCNVAYVGSSRVS